MDLASQADTSAPADGPWNDYTPQQASTPAPAAPPAQPASDGPWADYAPQQPPSGRDSLGGYLLPSGAGQQAGAPQGQSVATPGLAPTMLDKATDAGFNAFTFGLSNMGRAALQATVNSGGTWQDRYDAARDQQDAETASLPWYVRIPAEVLGGLASPIGATIAKGAGALYDVVAPNALTAGTGVAARTANALLRPAVEGAAVGGAQAVPDTSGSLSDRAGQIGDAAAAGAAFGAGTNVLFAGLGKGASLLSEAGYGPKNALLPESTPVTSGVADAAGKQIASAASDPAAVQAATAQPAVIVPGSQPTTFQATGDTGLGQLERGLRVAAGSSQAFLDRDAANNAARVGAVAGTAPTTASSSDLVDALTAQRDALAERAAQAQQAASQGTLQEVGGTGASTPTTAGLALRQAVDDARAPAIQQADQAVQQGQGQLQATLNQLGGQPAGDTGSALQQYGQQLRGTLATNRAAAAGNAGDLFKAIDPDGKLAISAAPIQQARQDILAGISPNAAPPAGEEAAILDRVGQMPAVQSFSDLGALKTRVDAALRAQRSSPTGDPQAIRRLAQLQSGIHDAIEGASNLVDVPPAAAGMDVVGASAQGGGVSPSPSTSTGQGVSPDVGTPSAAPALAVGDSVYLPSGQRVGVRYELADAGNLVTSNNADGSVNPAYPEGLQPRDRTRAASQVQVQRIAGQLQPERLGASSTASDGAPIVGADGAVESGNGRVAAIRQAYAQGGPQADAYRAWLENAGHDTSGMAQPVLIRRRVTPMTPEARAQFAAEANAPSTLSLSATERAAGDARRLTPDVLDTLQPGDVTAPGNRGFVRSYLRNVVTPGEEGSFVGADGSLSQEGAARVRAALVQRAYQDGGLTASLGESTSPEARVFAGAMQDAAPAMAKLRAGIEAGEVDKAVDIAPHLTEAARVVQSARQRGISLADAVAQRDAFTPTSEEAEGLLRHAYGPDLSGRMSREAFADSLGLYAQRAAEQHAAGNLFGAANMTAQELLDGTTGRYGRSISAASSQPQSTGFAGPGGRAERGGTGGFGDVAARSPNAGQGGSRGPSGQGSRVLPTASDARSASLTPNWTSEAGQKYAAARAAWADLKSRFDRAPGVGPVLRSGPTTGSYTMPDSLVPGALFGGKGAADRMTAAMRAGVLPHELADAMGHDLRMKAGTPDGGIDPGRAARWQANNAEAVQALRRMDPTTAGMFSNVQQLAQRVSDLQAARKMMDAAHPLADIRGGAEVMARAVRKGPVGADSLRRVLDAAGNAPEAVEAAGDYLAHQLRADAAPNGVIDQGKYASFRRNYAGALSTLPELGAKFDTAAAAQATMDDAAARSGKALLDFQKSAARSFTNGVPPDQAVGAILNRATAVPDMQALARLTENDPAARAGLQRAVADHVLTKFGGNTLAGQTGTTVLRSNQFQDWLKKATPALRQIMTPQQVDTLGRVGLDLQRANMSNAGTKAAVGSDTEQNRGVVTSLLGSVAKSGAAKALGILLGAAHGGLAGALGGEKLAGVAQDMMGRFRAAGIEQTRDLVAQAMLNPGLANVLLSRVNEGNRGNVLKALGMVLGRAAAGNAGAGMASRVAAAQAAR